ncbi:thioredoxin family protein [[Mycoplasma] collis]|uniref:thioredoxin family protein n=1 Tax=[Mycoplasma] collis TaxID=2127 RepID=UPI00051B5EAE|nr:thioredoxin family protein [[Mycoplasma] collis]
MSKLVEMKWADAQKIIDNGVVYLEFAVDWCGDCIMMKPIVEKVADHFKDNNELKMIKVNAEESGLFRKPNTKFEVLKVPTHIILKNGEIVFKHFEYIHDSILINEINKALKN